MSKMKRVLGLDLGTNSIGWMLLDTDDHDKGKVLDSGVRIFQEAVEAKTRTPKNQARREARSARKRLRRRARRKQVLRETLQEAGLLPNTETELLAVYKTDPYQLRDDGLSKKLTPHELGRAIYHLNQRRGFLSNRKTDLGDKDAGVVKESISELEDKIEKSSAQTLGQFLAKQDRKRGRYTHRQMLKDEFNALIKAQKKHHPDLITPELEARLFRIIFFQRPLRIQKHLIGRCKFEPRRHRAHIASLTFQKFRILQSVNNLEVRDPRTFEWRRLTDEERQTLISALDKSKTMKWDTVRKKLKLHEGEIFNLEQGRQSGLKGNETVFDLRKVLKDSALPWDSLTDKQQNQLVTDLMTIDKEGGLLRRLQEHWGLDEETSEKLAKVDLGGGVGRLSSKAMTKLIPFLEKGMTYDEACVEAGYDHSRPGGNTPVLPLLDAPPQLRNPVVMKALWETRKLVNNIIRVHGKPDVIRIEMAREMKQTRKQREEYQKRQKQLEHKRAQAREVLQRDFGIQQPTRGDIEKYNLWQECDQTCPYTGTPISAAMLFSDEVDVEHILPLSRSLDNSYMNKSLCIAHENRQVKRNRTPWETYSGDPERMEQVAQRVKGFSTMPWPKKQRFTKKELDTDRFIERQLNDTRYISREVKDFLKRTGADVQVTAGQLTWWLRGTWGLNRILAADGSGEKNRADHRHHAVDAAVIAVTSLGLYQRLSRLAQENPTERGLRDLEHYVPSPWDGFEDEVRDKVLGIIVSHAPLHKLHGALHEETAYGVADPGEDGKKMKLTYRVRLDTPITASQVKRIRDDRVRELVEERLDEFDGNAKKAFAEPLYMKKKDGSDGPPIETVRILNEVSPSSVFVLEDEEGHPLKAFQYGSNHHVEIIEHVETGKRKVISVTMLEAARRARIERKPMVRKDHGPEWKFIMALHINDMVEVVDDRTGELRVFRIQVLPGSDSRIELREHSAATLENKSEWIRKNPLSLSVKKLLIDPIGRVRESRD
jgi:CRISPR-associated endonuclease Csn1